MTKQATMFHALSWAALLAGASALGAEVLFERELDPATRERYRIRVTRGGLPRGTTAQEIAKIVERASKTQAVVKIELVDDQMFPGRKMLKTYCLGEDLVLEAESLAYRKDAMERLSCGRDIGKFTFVKTGGSKRPAGYMFFDGVDRLGTVTDRYRGPEREYVLVSMREVAEREIDPHNFLRRMIREECQARKTRFGYVVRSRDRWDKTTEAGQGRRISWLSGKHLAVYMTALGVEPDDLLPLYGERFRSTLPAGFRVDKTQWGREEMEFWLGRMARAIENQDATKGQHSYSFALHRMEIYIYIPVLDEASNPKASFELKKRQYEHLVQWWAANKEKTYWHKRMQKLVAKGYTPEELAKAAEKRAEAERQAILNAPFTTEELDAIKSALATKFEKRYRESTARRRELFGADCGAKVEKLEDYAWEIHTRQARDGVLIKMMVRGPELIRARRKEYPLRGVFTIRYFGEYAERKGKKEIVVEETYHYNRLRNLWLLGEPN